MKQEERPNIAIVDSNTLAVLGLRQILQNVMPIMSIETYGSFAELQANHPEHFVHFFVAMSIVLEHRDFFLEHQRRTIVLTNSTDPNIQLSGFHCLSINQPEKHLIKSLLMLEQHAHAHGKNLPPITDVLNKKILSDREIEVLALIAQGFLNKEIADLLSIGLTTVITHRKNITDKLGMKSVSALTIYAVMHGYVDINKLRD
ncbi:MAG: response regulator transcription factor [Prevotella sp.]|nr:response regulator transcription factor [Prevotella sp.]